MTVAWNAWDPSMHTAAERMRQAIDILSPQTARLFGGPLDHQWRTMDPAIMPGSDTWWRILGPYQAIHGGVIVGYTCAHVRMIGLWQGPIRAHYLTMPSITPIQNVPWCTLGVNR
jgi:hypothetical protein